MATSTAVATTENGNGESKSVTLRMADRFKMNHQAFEATLRATVVPANTSREEFAAFLLVAEEHGLNPITKEIYAFPKKGGGIQPIVGVDGWARLINEHPQSNGMEFEDIRNDKGELEAIKCKLYRKDRDHPVCAIEYMEECKRKTDPWAQWPRRMLRHKAMIQAARYAYGYAGIADPDEAGRIGVNAPRGDRMAQVVDAQMIDETGELISDEEAQQLTDELIDLDANLAGFLKVMEVDSVLDIRKSQLPKAMEMLASKRKQREQEAATA